MNPYSAAGRRLRAPYAALPVAGRAYVLARVLTCPFDGVAAHLPGQGTLLDVGCGAGLMAHLAAARGLSVTGVDPDPRKVALARASIGPGEAIEVFPGSIEEAARLDRRFDAVLFLDVLYLLPPEAQARALQGAAALLAPGGRVLVKTMHRESRVRSALDAAQEAVATGVGMTKGEAYPPPDEAFVRQVLQQQGLLVRAVRLDRGYVHPHLLVIGEAS